MLPYQHSDDHKYPIEPQIVVVVKQCSVCGQYMLVSEQQDVSPAFRQPDTTPPRIDFTPLGYTLSVQVRYATAPETVPNPTPAMFPPRWVSSLLAKGMTVLLARLLMSFLKGPRVVNTVQIG